MGARYDQWWRFRDAVTVGRLAVLAAVVMLAAIGCQLTRIDWAAYGPAELPDSPEHIDNSLATLRSVQMGDFEALEVTPTFTWSQFVSVRVEADCAAGRFHVHDPTRRWGEPVKNPDLLRSSLGLEIVRRSSIGDGSAVSYRVVSGARVNRDNEMSWSNKVWIPHVPGTYRVRVIMLTRQRGARNSRRESEPIVIGSFKLHVEPGEPSA